VRGFATEVDVVGLDGLKRIATRVNNLGEDTTPLLEIFGSVLEASVLRRFGEQRGPGGVPWPKSKRALKQGGKTLTDTGDLRDSIRYVIRPGEVEVGSDGLKNPVKAIANQFGSHRQAVVLAHTRTINSAFGVPLPKPVTFNVRPHGMVTNLPARPFVGIDDEDKADMHELGLEYLKGLFQ
jgi:phage gpG-like protein